jgi:hypothetical protein
LEGWDRVLGELAGLKDSYPIELAEFAKALGIVDEPAFAWFEVLEDGKNAPQGYTKASGHIIWDLTMDFTRKARWVLDGHKLPTPEGSTYAGVVSQMCENSTDLCGAKWTGSMYCEHQECLSASAFLL